MVLQIPMARSCSQLWSLKTGNANSAGTVPQSALSQRGPVTVPVALPSPLGCVRFHWPGSVQSLPTPSHWTMSLFSHPGTPTRKRNSWPAADSVQSRFWPLQKNRDFPGFESRFGPVLDQGYQGVSGSIRNQDQGWGHQGSLISGSRVKSGSGQRPAPGSTWLTRILVGFFFF